ncbi:MAG TPA: hypothetical protein VMT50_01240 [Steroidobacteraceae bacterium]|nr:hypothetical protein [Steroidobacteraceae bacterium]
MNSLSSPNTRLALGTAAGLFASVLVVVATLTQAAAGLVAYL